MKPWEALPMALASLTNNKLRSALTILGIIIGVAAVIALMSIGEGVQKSITDRISGVGSNLVFVYPGSQAQTNVRSATGISGTLTLADAQAIADPNLVPSAGFVAPEVSQGLQVSAGGQNTRAQVLGVTPEYLTVRNHTISSGEFISELQVQAKSPVAVLGASIAGTLFAESDAVEQTVRINRQPFRVIGVLASKGGTGFGSQDNVIMVPISAMTSRLAVQRTTQGAINVNTITVQVPVASQIDAAKAEITELLRDRHGVIGNDDFTVTAQEDLLDALRQVTGVFTLFLGAIAGISLVVGGIGVMNIMLVSVTERTREIGIRKAAGAKRRDVLLQFLAESAALSLVGGVIGIGLGWSVSRLIGGTSFQGQAIVTVVSPNIVLLAVSVSIAIGIFFGIYPASRAARLRPIEALRFE